MARYFYLPGIPLVCLQQLPRIQIRSRCSSFSSIALQAGLLPARQASTHSRRLCNHLRLRRNNNNKFPSSRLLHKIRRHWKRSWQTLSRDFRTSLTPTTTCIGISTVSTQMYSRNTQKWPSLCPADNSWLNWKPDWTESINR